MKNILGSLLAIAFVVTVPVLAQVKLFKPHTAPSGFVTVADTASTTTYALEYEEYDFAGKFTQQKTCLRVRDGSSLLFVTFSAQGVQVSASKCGGI